jgi:hypothetical protein
MGIVIRTKSLIDNSYKSIRLCDSYEEIIHKIMNDSKVVFPSSYIHIEPAKQSNGQPDFIDALNSQDIFDAKLLFSEELCRDLSKEEFEKFVIKLKEDVSFDVPNQRDKGPYDLPIFIDMKAKIEKLTGNEKGILFLPFHVSLKHSNSFIALCSDVFDYCFEYINTEHEVYLICLNDYNEVVLSKLGTSKIEFLPNVYFNNMVSVDIVGYKID